MEKIQKNQKIDRISNVIICFIFALYIVIQMYESTVFGFIEQPIILKLAKYMCYFFFGTKILFDVIRDKKFPIRVIPMLIVSVLIYIFIRKSTMIIIITMILAMRKCDLKQIIKIVFFVYTLFFVLVICGALIGVIPDWVYAKYLKEEKTRHSLGFYYPTLTMNFYIMITLMYSYIRKSNIKYIELIILQGINCFLFAYTKARLGFLLITGFLLLILLYKIFRRKKDRIKKFLNNKVIKTVCCAIPIILLLIMFLLTYLYKIDKNNEVIDYIDNVLSGRLRLNCKAINTYQINLFGTKMKWFGMGGVGYTHRQDKYYFNNYNFVDSSYIKMFFDHGIIMSVMIIVSYVLFIWILGISIIGIPKGNS